MSVFSTSLFSLTPGAFWHWGRLLLVGAFALGLLLIVFLTWQGLWMGLLFLPALPLVGLAAWYLFQHPLLNLCVVIFGFVVVADNEAGFQIQELIYAAYLYAFLSHWYLTRLFVYRERLFYTIEDKVWLAFLLLIPCTMPISILFGGDTSAMVSELIAWTMAAIYFPIKEACARYEKGIPAILLVLALVGIGVALRNAYFFSRILSDATMAWQVATGRVATNDHLMMVSSLFGLALVIGARRGWHVILLLGYFLVAFAGLILTQSRGYWLAFLLGAGAMFVFVDAAYRKRMLLLGVLGMVALLGIGFVFFSSYIELMLDGIIKRFSTLQTAASSDLSLVNRFRETAAVWDKIVQNPILGYGMGVTYTFYDIAHESTDIDAFVHNGYVGLWYKFGLWGLCMVLFFWARSIWRGLQAFRLQGVSHWLRMAGLAASICLVAFTLSAITSNPFYLKDSIFIFSLLASLAAGAYHRGRVEQMHLDWVEQESTL